MNANHTVAGLFDGALNPDSCIVNISGTGAMIFPSGLQGINTHNSSDSSLGWIILNVPVNGAGAPTLQGNGQVFLNGTNGYTGGTFFGYSGGAYNGVLNFASSNALGTGALTVSNTVQVASPVLFILDLAQPPSRTKLRGLQPMLV